MSTSTPTSPTADGPTPGEVVAAFWAAQARGDAATAREQLAPDLEWVVVGRTHPVARTYHGPDGFFGELIAELGRAFEPGSVSLRVTAQVEAGPTVVTEVHETARARNGEEFVIDLLTVMEVVDGRIRTCREYMDLLEVSRSFPS